MFFSIDRIDSGRAVLVGEDEKLLEISSSMLPKGAKEGDVLQYHQGKFTIDKERTDQRRKEVARMLAKLLNKPDNEQK